MSPALPREVWAFAVNGDDAYEADVIFRPTKEEAEEARVLDEHLYGLTSPIGRYVLAGTEQAETEARVAAWLRKSEGVAAEMLHEIADAIERGEHRRERR